MPFASKVETPYGGVAPLHHLHTSTCSTCGWSIRTIVGRGMLGAHMRAVADHKCEEAR